MNKAIVFIGSSIEPEVSVMEVRESISDTFKKVKFSEFVMSDFENIETLNGVVYFQTGKDLVDLEKYLNEIEDRLDQKVNLNILIFNHEVVHSDYTDYKFIQKMVNEVDD